MLGSRDPETVLSNKSSYNQNSVKQIHQNSEEMVRAYEKILDSFISSPKDQLSDGQIYQHKNRYPIRDRTKSLKKKKQYIKKDNSNIQGGPKRIMYQIESFRGKYMGKARKSSHENRQENQQERQEFDRNEEQRDQNQTFTSHLKEEQGLDQNYIDLFTNAKNKFFRKRTLRFHANAQILFPMSTGTKYHFSMTRKHEGIKYFLPEFELIDEQKQIIIYCKKTRMFQFAFTLKSGEWSQDSQSYIGKLVSNISGSILNFYLKVQFKQTTQQRIICSIEYTNRIFAFKKPRTMEVFLLDLSKLNLEDKKYKNISSLRQVYDKQLGNPGINYFCNKPPTYNKTDKIYSLDFHGRAPICSVKNFILEEPSHRGRQYLLFGKKGDNNFNLDFMNPLSPLNAFSIAVSSFNGKIICE